MKPPIENVIIDVFGLIPADFTSISATITSTRLMLKSDLSSMGKRHNSSKCPASNVCRR